jgi:hypothetical protein
VVRTYSERLEEVQATPTGTPTRWTGPLPDRSLTRPNGDVSQPVVSGTGSDWLGAQLLATWLPDDAHRDRNLIADTPFKQVATGITALGPMVFVDHLSAAGPFGELVEPVARHLRETLPPGTGCASPNV